MKLSFYQGLLSFFTHPPRRQRIFIGVCRHLPKAIAVCYLITAIGLFWAKDARWIRFCVVPAVTFLSATLLRHVLNFPRPYEVFPLTPLVSAKRTGHSFPSRHTVSATVIAFEYGVLWWPLGVVFGLLALAVAFCRVAAGLHFVRDVLCAMAYALLFSGIAYGIL